MRNFFSSLFLTLKNNFAKHLVYTFFIAAVSSIISSAVFYFISTRRINTLQESLNIVHNAAKISPPPVQNGSGQSSIQPNDNTYVERASPPVGSESANIIFHGPRNKKQIALTFDAEMTDGMRLNLLSGKVSSSYNKKIIDILNQTHTKATLFLTGMWIEIYPDVTKELSKNPLFELGSHSYTDSSYAGFCYGLNLLKDTLKIEDIGSTEKLLREHAGVNNQLFRFPGGCSTPNDVKLVNEADDSVVHWDVSGNDGFNQNTQQIIHNVVDNVQNGSIIILHLNGAPTAPRTADALPDIISKLKAKGFIFVKVNELLGFPPEERERGF